MINRIFLLCLVLGALLGTLLPDLEQFFSGGTRGFFHTTMGFSAIVGAVIMTSFAYFLFHHFHEDEKYVKLHHEHNLQYELFVLGFIVFWGLHLIFDGIV